jgi:uncharacterized protein (TIGR03083 family)
VQAIAWSHSYARPVSPSQIHTDTRLTDSAGDAPSLELVNAPIVELIRIWLDALDSFAAVAAELNRDQWVAASPCPGWSAADVVAHVLSLEAELAGQECPAHEPDWSTLPHVSNPLSQVTERPVDWYRGQAASTVTSELDHVIAVRRKQLADEPTDPTATVIGPFGGKTSRELMIQIRILDIWLHEQDLRIAADLPGGLGREAAWVTAARIVLGLPRSWSKIVGAPVGSSLRLSVTGPGVVFDKIVVVGADGRGRFTAFVDGDPTVTLTVPWLRYAQLAGGRLRAVEQALSGGARLDGDRELGLQLVRSLAVTP